MTDQGKKRAGGCPGIHVWHTALRKEQLPARMREGERSFGPDWRLEWKELTDGYRLWLRSDLPILRIRGQTPLRLWVRAENEGCRVTGVFLPPLWSVAFDILVPLLLAGLIPAQSGRAVPWWVPAAMIVFLLLAPRLFTVWGRDRRLLEWIGEALDGEDMNRERE